MKSHAEVRLYLLVAHAGERVLDRMGWISALLAAEAPLAGGVARATGHPGSVQAAAAPSRVRDVS